MNRAFFAWLVILLAALMPARAAEPPQNFVLYDAARPLPEIRFEDAEAKPLSLTDFRGKVVLLNIWATWCGPCRKEMPTLDRLQAKLGGADFEVVALSIDEGGPDVVRKFYAEIGIRQLPIYMHPSGATPQALGVVGIPTTLLIDRRGQELGRLVGPAEWDAPEMISLLESVIARQADSPSAPQQEE
ncbi:TlpA family protein disulfide reductase [Hypericibacter sp.]|uniref:TlpA family protein disulfide reductase n=1 Tax=Hypericibacter sp. TaxID=2705401 RepID=UPI003D6D6F4B